MTNPDLKIRFSQHGLNVGVYVVISIVRFTLEQKLRCTNAIVDLHVGISAYGKFLLCIARWMYRLINSDQFNFCSKKGKLFI